MIIREQQNNLVLITQPHHAAISGIFAGHWKVTTFNGFNRLEEFLFTVHHHDQCWTEADKVPLLNPDSKRPYSFDDYPEERKIELYRKGIDNMENEHPYPALLCSRHFASFFAGSETTPGKEFYHSETQRQQRLTKQMNLNGLESEGADFHFNLLQFCDNLSLFICLNEEGKNQHPWFKKGFSNSERLGVNKHPLKADWKNPDTLKIAPFPFDEPFSIQLEYRRIPSLLPDQETLIRYWENAPVQTKTIHFVEPDAIP